MMQSLCIHEFFDNIQGKEGLVAYVDGACSFNPGPGGWGVILIYERYTTCVSGFDSATTNNKMELEAAINAVQVARENGFNSITIYTDSAYVKNGITIWVHNWIKNNWRTSTKESVKNKELWVKLMDLCSVITVDWYWVKGHSDNEWNNAVDLLARNAIHENIKTQLRK